MLSNELEMYIAFLDGDLKPNKEDVPRYVNNVLDYIHDQKTLQEFIDRIQTRKDIIDRLNSEFTDRHYRHAQLRIL